MRETPNREIDKLINKRLKAFQLRQWTDCFCCRASRSHRILDIFPCSRCFCSSFFRLQNKSVCFHNSLWVLSNQKKKDWKTAKWKIQLKLASAFICCVELHALLLWMRSKLGTLQIRAVTLKASQLHEVSDGKFNSNPIRVSFRKLFSSELEKLESSV